MRFDCKIEALNQKSYSIEEAKNHSGIYAPIEPCKNSDLADRLIVLQGRHTFWYSPWDSGSQLYPAGEEFFKPENRGYKMRFRRVQERITIVIGSTQI